MIIREGSLFLFFLLLTTFVAGQDDEKLRITSNLVYLSGSEWSQTNISTCDGVAHSTQLNDIGIDDLFVDAELGITTTESLLGPVSWHQTYDKKRNFYLTAVTEEGYRWNRRLEGQIVTLNALGNTLVGLILVDFQFEYFSLNYSISTTNSISYNVTYAIGRYQLEGSSIQSVEYGLSAVSLSRSRLFFVAEVSTQVGPTLCSVNDGSFTVHDVVLDEDFVEESFWDALFSEEIFPVFAEDVSTLSLSTPSENALKASSDYWTLRLSPVFSVSPLFGKAESSASCDFDGVRYAQASVRFPVNSTFHADDAEIVLQASWRYSTSVPVENLTQTWSDVIAVGGIAWERLDLFDFAKMAMASKPSDDVSCSQGTVPMLCSDDPLDLLAPSSFSSSVSESEYSLLTFENVSDALSEATWSSSSSSSSGSRAASSMEEDMPGQGSKPPSLVSLEVISLSSMDAGPQTSSVDGLVDDHDFLKSFVESLVESESTSELDLISLFSVVESSVEEEAERTNSAEASSTSDFLSGYSSVSFLQFSEESISDSEKAPGEVLEKSSSSSVERADFVVESSFSSKYVDRPLPSDQNSLEKGPDLASSSSFSDEPSEEAQPEISTIKFFSSEEQSADSWFSEITEEGELSLISLGAEDGEDSMSAVHSLRSSSVVEEEPDSVLKPSTADGSASSEGHSSSSFSSDAAVSTADRWSPSSSSPHSSSASDAVSSSSSHVASESKEPASKQQPEESSPSSSSVGNAVFPSGDLDRPSDSLSLLSVVVFSEDSEESSIFLPKLSSSIFDRWEDEASSLPSVLSSVDSRPSRPSVDSGEGLDNASSAFESSEFLSDDSPSVFSSPKEASNPDDASSFSWKAPSNATVDSSSSAIVERSEAVSSSASVERSEAVSSPSASSSSSLQGESSAASSSAPASWVSSSSSPSISSDASSTNSALSSSGEDKAYVSSSFSSPKNDTERRMSTGASVSSSLSSGSSPSSVASDTSSLASLSSSSSSSSVFSSSLLLSASSRTSEAGGGLSQSDASTSTESVSSSRDERISSSGSPSRYYSSDASIDSSFGAQLRSSSIGDYSLLESTGKTSEASSDSLFNATASSSLTFSAEFERSSSSLQSSSDAASSSFITSSASMPLSQSSADSSENFLSIVSSSEKLVSSSLSSIDAFYRDSSSSSSSDSSESRSFDEYSSAGGVSSVATVGSSSSIEAVLSSSEDTISSVSERASHVSSSGDVASSLASSSSSSSFTSSSSELLISPLNVTNVVVTGKHCVAGEKCELRLSNPCTLVSVLRSPSLLFAAAEVLTEASTADSACAIVYSATRAGSYVLSLRLASEATSEADLNVTVKISSGEIDWSSSVSSSLPETVALEAGKEIAVAFALVDAFGNTITSNATFDVFVGDAERTEAFLCSALCNVSFSAIRKNAFVEVFDSSGRRAAFMQWMITPSVLSACSVLRRSDADLSRVLAGETRQLYLYEGSDQFGNVISSASTNVIAKGTLENDGLTVTGRGENGTIDFFLTVAGHYQVKVAMRDTRYSSSAITAKATMTTAIVCSVIPSTFTVQAGEPVRVGLFDSGGAKVGGSSVGVLQGTTVRLRVTVTDAFDNGIDGVRPSSISVDCSNSLISASMTAIDGVLIGELTGDKLGVSQCIFTAFEGRLSSRVGLDVSLDRTVDGRLSSVLPLEASISAGSTCHCRVYARNVFGATLQNQHLRGTVSTSAVTPDSIASVNMLVDREVPLVTISGCTVVGDCSASIVVANVSLGQCSCLVLPADVATVVSENERSVVAGESLSVPMRFKDAFNNTVETVSSEALSFGLERDGVMAFDALQLEAPNASLAVFRARWTGFYAISVYLSSQYVGVLTTVRVRSAAVYLQRSEVTVSTETVQAGDQFSLDIALVDAYGNRASLGTQRLILKLSNSSFDGLCELFSQSQQPSTSVTVTGGAETLTIAAFCRRARLIMLGLEGSLDGAEAVSLRQTAVEVTPGSFSSAMSGVRLVTATASLYAGEPLAVDVELRDHYSNVIRDEGRLLSVANDPQNAFFVDAGAATVEQRGNHYRLTVLMKGSAVYKLSVLRAGVALPGSPLSVDVSPGAIDPQSTAIQVSKTDVEAGEAMVVQVNAFDSFGSRLVNVSSEVLDWFGTDSSTTKISDSDFAVRFTKAGEILLRVGVAGVEFIGSSVSVIVRPGEAWPQNTLTLVRLSQVVAGEAVSATVVLRDKYGNRKPYDPFRSTESLSWNINGSFSTLEAPAQGEYEYQSKLPLTVAGSYVVSVQLFELQISSSVVKVIASSFSVSNSFFSVGHVGGTARAGSTVKLVVRGFDRFGNAIDDDKVSVEYSSSTPSGAVSAIASSGELVVTESGTYRVAATSQGKHVRGSPADVVAHAAIASAEHCLAFGSGVFGTVIGSDLSVTVAFRDQYGNPTGFGAENTTVTFTCGGSSFEGQQILGSSASSEEQKFAIAYEVSAPCEGSTVVQVDNKHVAGSPFRVKLVSLSDTVTISADSYLQEAQLSLVASTTATLHVQMVDERGILIPSTHATAGDLGFEASLISADESRPLSMAPTEDGTFGVNVSSTQAGSYSVRVLLKGKSIRGSPLNLTIGAGPVSGAKTTLRLPSSEDGRAVTAGLSVICIAFRDSFGNRIDAFSALFELSGPSCFHSDEPVQITSPFVNGTEVCLEVELQRAQQGLLKLCAIGDFADSCAVLPQVAVMPDTSTARLLVSGDVNTTVTAGTALVVFFSAVDSYGNVVPITDNVSFEGGNVSIPCASSKCSFAFNVTGRVEGRVFTSGIGQSSLLVFHINSASMNPESSIASLMTDQEITAGDQTVLTVLLRDRYGNKVEDSGVNMVAQARKDGFTLASFGLKVNTASAESYEGRAILALRGNYVLSVFRGGQRVGASPLVVRVRPAAPSESSSSILAVEPRVSKAGEGCRVVAAVRDEFGNALSWSEAVELGYNGSVQVVGLEYDESFAPFYAKLNDGDGSTIAGDVAAITIAGRYNWSLVIRGNALSSRESYVVPASAASAICTTACPSSVKAGEGFEAFFVVRDGFGNALRPGSYSVNASAVLVQSNVCEDRLCSFALFLTSSGIYNIGIKLNGTAGWLPLTTTTVVSSSPQSALSEWETRNESRVIAGETVLFTVWPRDSFGNPVLFGSLGVSVTLRHGSLSELALQSAASLRGREWVANATITTSGEYNVDVALRMPGEATVMLEGKSLLVEAASADVSQFSLDMGPLRRVIEGTQYEVPLRVRDRFANPVASSLVDSAQLIANARFFGGLNFSAVLQFVPEEAGSSTAIALLTAPARGNYRVAVDVAGVVLVKSHFVDVLDRDTILTPDPTQSAVVFEKKVSPAGSSLEARASIVSTDGIAMKMARLQKNITLQLASSPGLSNAIFAEASTFYVSSEDSQVMTWKLALTVAGTYSVGLKLNGEVLGSLASVVVTPGVFSLSQSTLMMSSSELAAGETLSVYIEPRDVFGNGYDVSVDDTESMVIRALITPTNETSVDTVSALFIADVSSGLFLAKVRPTFATNYLARITHKDESEERPFTVMPGTAVGSNTLVRTSEDGSVAGTTLVLSMRFYDAFKNPLKEDSRLTTAVEGTVSFAFADSSAVVQEFRFAVGFAATTIPFVMTRSGSYVASVDFSAGVSGIVSVSFASRKQLLILPAPAETSQTRFRLDPREAVEAGSKRHLRVAAHDAFGNAVPSSWIHVTGLYRLNTTAAIGKREEWYRFGDSTTAVSLSSFARSVGGSVSVSSTEYEVEAVLQGIQDGRWELQVNVSSRRSSSLLDGFSADDLVSKPQNPVALKEARFSPSGTSITVAFVEPTNRGRIAGVVPSEEVFAAETVAKLGESSKVRWENTTVMAILLGFRPTISLTDTLRFDGVRREILTLQENSLPFKGLSKVLPPLERVAPIPLLQASQQIGECDDLELNAEQTWNGAGRPITFRWGVVGSGSDVQRIRELLREQSLGRVTVNATLIPPNATLQFVVRVANFFGYTAEASATVHKTVYSPPVIAPEFSSSVRAYANRQTVIRIMSRLPICRSIAMESSFRWKQLSGPPLSLGEALSRRDLFIPANTLRGGSTLSFEVEARLVEFPTVFSTATIEVTVAFSTLEVKLNYFGKVVQFMDSDLSIYVEKAIDPDRSEEIDASWLFSYRWQCSRRHIDTGDVSQCFDIAFVNQEQLQYVYQLNEDVATLFFPVTAVRALFSLEHEYTFSVTATKEPGTFPGDPPRQATAEATVIMKEARVPQIHILSVPEKVEPSERLRLESVVVNASDWGPLDFVWDVIEGDVVLLDQDEASDAISESVVRALPSRLLRSIVLPELSLTPGGKYTFRVTVITESGVESYAEVKFTANDVPVSGDCSVSPSSGFFEVTNFAFECIGWEDEDTPLSFKYAWFWRTVDGATLEREDTEVTHSDRARVHDFYFPLALNGSSAAESATAAVVIEVYDSRGSFVSLERSISLERSPDSVMGTEANLSSAVARLTDASAVGNEVDVAALSLQLEMAMRTMGEETAFSEQLRSFLVTTLSNMLAGIVLYRKSQMELYMRLLPLLNDRVTDTGLTQNGTVDSFDRLVNLPFRPSLSSFSSVCRAMDGFFSGSTAADDRRDRVMSSLMGQMLTGTVAGEEAVQYEGNGIAALTFRTSSEVIGHSGGTGLFSTRQGGSGSGNGRFSGRRLLLSADEERAGADVDLSGALQEITSSEGVGEMDVQVVAFGKSPHGVTRNATGSPVLRVDFVSGNSEYAVNNLSAPIQFTLTSNQSLCSVNEVLPTCQYYVNSSGSWDGGGCIATSVTCSEIVCTCFHATDFGSFFEDMIPEFNTIDAVADAVLFQTIGEDSLLSFIVVGMVYTLYIVLLVPTILLERRRKDPKAAYVVDVDIGVEAPSTFRAPIAYLSKSTLMKNLKSGVSRWKLLKLTFMERVTRTTYLVSIFFKPGDIPYSRPQRLTTFCTYLLMSIAVQALFVGLGVIPLQQKLFIGVVAAVVLVPVLIIFEIMFTTVSMAIRRYKAQREEQRREKMIAMGKDPTLASDTASFTNKKSSEERTASKASSRERLSLKVLPSKEDHEPIKEKKQLAQRRMKKISAMSFEDLEEATESDEGHSSEGEEEKAPATPLEEDRTSPGSKAVVSLPRAQQLHRMSISPGAGISGRSLTDLNAFSQSLSGGSIRTGPIGQPSQGDVKALRGKRESIAGGAGISGQSLMDLNAFSQSLTGSGSVRAGSIGQPSQGDVNALRDRRESIGGAGVGAVPMTREALAMRIAQEASKEGSEKTESSPLYRNLLKENPTGPPSSLSGEHIDSLVPSPRAAALAPDDLEAESKENKSRLITQLVPTEEEEEETTKSSRHRRESLVRKKGDLTLSKMFERAQKKANALEAKTTVRRKMKKTVDQLEEHELKSMFDSRSNEAREKARKGWNVLASSNVQAIKLMAAKHVIKKEKEREKKRKLRAELKKIKGLRGVVLDLLEVRPKKAKRFDDGSKLPPYAIVLPYAMAAFASLVSTYFIILYGLKFDTEMEITWFRNIGISLVQEFFVFEFLIAFGISFLTVMVLPRVTKRLESWATKPVKGLLDNTSQLAAVVDAKDEGRAGLKSTATKRNKKGPPFSAKEIVKSPKPVALRNKTVL